MCTCQVSKKVRRFLIFLNYVLSQIQVPEPMIHILARSVDRSGHEEKFI